MNPVPPRATLEGKPHTGVFLLALVALMGMFAEAVYAVHHYLLR